MSACFYCLSKEPSIQVCVSCRTRFELCEREMEYYKKNCGIWKACVFRIEKENERLRKALEKKRGKKK